MVGVVLVAAAAIPSSAAANSAFDQYVEVPPESGSKNPGKPGDKGQKGSGEEQGKTTTSGAGSSDSDAMVAWATGQDTGGPGSSAAGGSSGESNRSAGSSGGDGNGATAPAIGKSLGSVSVDTNGAPIALIVAMALSALIAASVMIARKRQFD